MSRGSERVTVRVPDALLGELDAAVASNTRGEPWTRSSFLLHALRMELARRQRARTWRRTSKGSADALEGATHEQH